MLRKTNPDSEYIKKSSEIIEKTLDAFGITTRVAEVINNKDNILFSLEIVMGIPIEDIENRSREIALALAAPEGKVEIIAPIPGRALVGIVVKKRSNLPLPEEKMKYKFIYIQQKQYVKNSLIDQIRNGLAVMMSLVATLVWRLAEIVQADRADVGQDAKDELFEEAVELVKQEGKASASTIQRRLSIGYARAARILDQMEYDGIVGPQEGSKPREVLVN